MSFFFFDEICCAVEKADKDAFSKHKCTKHRPDDRICECSCKCRNCSKQPCSICNKHHYH